MNKYKNEDYQSISLKISQYEQDMYSWWAGLQKDSIAEWGLLVGIACWGIPNKTAQLIAFIAAIVLFFSKIVLINNNSNFSKIEKGISYDMDISECSDDEKIELSTEFKRVKKIRKNIPKIIMLNWRFLLGYIFLLASFLYNLFIHLGYKI
ncbi:hypothetical protein [Providencia stuartii]|uniref:hypothetical protein n=1 Tax=Providencia stuartii TaxID=588 RepID=UPI00111F92B1